MGKPKRWFWVWEADRITGRRVSAVVKIKAVSAAQARNFYRHKFYEGQPFEALDNLIVASEVGSGVNPALDPSPTPEPVGKSQAPPEPQQEELDLGTPFALPEDYFRPRDRPHRHKKR